MRHQIIGVMSQKGGVGKTTIAVNLAVMLRLKGYETLIVDLDTSNPSVGIHLGMHESEDGLEKFLIGSKGINEFLTVHAPSGLHVLLGSIDSPQYNLTDVCARKLRKEIVRSAYDFVILDTPPGPASKEIARELIDEAMIITTPDMPSCTSAFRIAAHLDRLAKRHSLIINKRRTKMYEISERTIRTEYNGRIYGVIAEDERVIASVGEHIPAVLRYRDIGFSRSINRIAEEYTERTTTGQKRSAKTDSKVSIVTSTFSRIFGRWKPPPRAREGI